MQDKSLAKLAYGLFLLTTATLFLRPAELFEWMEGWPIYECLIISALALSFQALVAHFQWFAMARQPVTLCLVGFFIAIALSHLQYIYLGGVIESCTLYLKTLIYYALLITTVNSPRRLRGLFLTVGICASTMVTLCVLDFYEILDFQFIEHLDDVEGFDEDEEELITVRRMRGTGLFQDPNDLAQVICLTAVICSYFLMDATSSKLKVLWIVPLIVLFIGLLETKSRGGLMACGMAGLAVVGVRYGGKIAIGAAIIAISLLPFVAGRQANMAMEEGGTGHERVTLWREGLQELKSPAILFGTGQGTYGDIAGLVAHNSFVHSYVELGLFGGTMFFGAFFFACFQLYRMTRLEEPILNFELIQMRPYICGMLVGWIMSIFSLSRCYVVPTHLLIGTVATYLNLVWIHTETALPLIIWNRGHAARLCFCSALMFCGLWIFTAVMT